MRLDRQINGHFPSVVFVLFVIHYLQQTTPPVLPVLHVMITSTEGEGASEGGVAEGGANEEGGAEGGVTEEPIDPDITQLMSIAKGWSTDNRQSVGELFYGLLK